MWPKPAHFLQPVTYWCQEALPLPRVQLWRLRAWPGPAGEVGASSALLFEVSWPWGARDASPVKQRSLCLLLAHGMVGTTLYETCLQSINPRSGMQFRNNKGWQTRKWTINTMYEVYTGRQAPAEGAVPCGPAGDVNHNLFSSSQAGLCTPWPRGQIWPTACFYK